MDRKEELEIKKLGYEIENLKGRKVRGWIQALAPILAVGGTILVLYLTDFIGTSEKLLEIQRHELADTISNYKNIIESQKSLLKKDLLQISLLRVSENNLKKAIETSKASLTILQIKNNSLHTANTDLENKITKTRDSLNSYYTETVNLTKLQYVKFKGLEQENGRLKIIVSGLQDELSRVKEHNQELLDSLVRLRK